MENSHPRLVRTFSSSNHHAASKIREYIASQDKMQALDVNLAKDVTKSSMIVPTLQKITRDGNERLAKYTISLAADIQSLGFLEKDHIINWCPHARTLIPFHTDSDGNCLMHAVSIYIWGVHDRSLTLRNLLHKKLERALRSELYHRWKIAQEESLREIQTSFPSIEFARDWDTVINMSSLLEFPMGNRGQKYSPLEDIHIFTIGNILARPIIVLSERVHHGSNGASLQPNQIGGIYLPLLRDPYDCEKSPIIIGYTTGHFVPLLSGEDMDMLISSHSVHPDAQHCIPLVYSDMSDIPIRFMKPHETRDALLTRYTDCIMIPIVDEIFKPAVSLKFKSPPAWSVELMYSLYSKAQETFHEYISSGADQDRYAASTATPGPSTFREPVNGFREQTHFMQQSNSRAYSQAPLTTGYSGPGISAAVTFAGSNTDRKPCTRVHSGCRNFGEERFNRFCRDCYFSMIPQRSERDEMERSEVYGALKRPPPIPTSTPHARIPEPPTAVFSREPYTSECLISHCKNQGRVEFMDMCESCYRDRIKERPTDLPKSDIRPSPTSAAPRKVFCADPGCQEDIVPGTDRCEAHLHGKPNCITENCGKKAVDNEIPLCIDCREKNLEASERHIRKSPPISNAEFRPPVVYQTFEKVKPSPATRAFPQYPQSSYDQPQWQLAMNRDKSRASQTRPPIYATPHCGNYGLRENDNLCNECYTFKMQYYGGHERRRNEVAVGGYRHGQQFGSEGERQRAFDSSVTPAVRSQIESKLRKADYVDMSFNGNQSHAMNSDRSYSAQRTAVLGGDVERRMENGKDQRYEGQHNYRNQSIYANEEEIEALRRYGQPQKEENIYEEIEDPRGSGRIFGGAQAFRRPSNEALSSERPIDSPRMQGGFVNEGYQPGNYSVMEERRQSRNKCTKPGCTNNRGRELDGLCETCHAESVKVMEQERYAKKLAYVNPIPCKTRGCPRFAEGSSKEFCESCLRRPERNFMESAAASSTTAVAGAYGGGMDTGRREAISTSNKPPNKCVTTSCDFYASGEFGPYCSKCFMEQTKLDTVNSSRVGDTLTSFPENQRLEYLVRGSGVENMPCRREGCELFGRPERNGYCSQCYGMYL